MEVVFQEFDATLQRKGQYSETALEVNNFYYYPALLMLVCYTAFVSLPISTRIKYHPRKKNHSTTLNIQCQHSISATFYNNIKNHSTLIGKCFPSICWQSLYCFQTVISPVPPPWFLLFFLWLRSNILMVGSAHRNPKALRWSFLPSFLRASLVATTTHPNSLSVHYISWWEVTHFQMFSYNSAHSHLLPEGEIYSHMK